MAHGQVLSDPFHWMRAENWDAVLADGTALADDITAYINAENSYTQSMLQDTEALQQQLVAEMRSRMPDVYSELPEIDGPYAYYWRYRSGEDHPVFARVPVADESSARRALLALEVPSSEQVLLDVQWEAAQHEFFDTGDLEVSPDHQWLAWTADCVGSEQCTLFIRDLETGTDLDYSIERVASVSWLDGELLVYVEQDDFHRANQVWRHKVVKEPTVPRETDVLLYKESDPAFDVCVGRLRSGEYLEISSACDTEDEIRLLNTSRPLDPPLLVQARTPGLEYSIDHLTATASADGQDRLVILTNADGATDFKLMQTTLETPSVEYWTDYLPHSSGHLLLSLDVFQRWIVWSVRVEGLTRVCWTDARSLLPVDVYRFAPEVNAYDLSIDPSPDYTCDMLRYSVDSPTTPAAIYDLPLKHAQPQLLLQHKLPNGHNPDLYRTWRVKATSHDGVEVPLTCVARADTELDGTAPLVLEVYGSYGSSLTADFCSDRLSLLDRGYVYALAHVRGGQECGRHWYDSARGAQKTNTFKDVVACADHLVNTNVATAQALSLVGRSAGGLAVGAVLNQAPSRFTAAIADMPFVDVLSTMLDATLPLTPGEWSEWGNPIKSLEDYQTIAAYSPVDNVTTQTYPALMVSAALADPRVGYWEPMKWVARLRAANTGSNPLLLHVNTQAGHFGAVGRFAALAELAREFAFILKVDGSAKWET